MKLSLVEYGRGIDLDNLFIQSVSLENVKSLLERANSIIKRALGIKRDTLVISNGNLRALGVAGVMRLSKDIELEIIPKMLKDDDSSDWKESLFLLAALSKYGNIITSEHIHSNTAYIDSLYDIAGRILAREYSKNQRKPIRQYRRSRFYDYSIDGVIDFETVFEKNPDGIPQIKVSFDKINPYNSTIQSAMRIVLPYIKDTSTRQIIIRAIQELSKQVVAPKNRLSVPPRNKEWTEIYNLSFDIVSGMGSSLENGEIMSPSFIVDTWRIWEWLITIAMKIGLGSDFAVVPQATTAWGIKRVNEKTYKVNVFPDVAIFSRDDMLEPFFLVDAKYKVLPDEGSFDIDRLDLYEAFAFCHATGVKRLFLVYPAVVGEEHETGSVSLMSDYEIGSITISVIKVAFGSITKQGDIMSFCKKMATELLDVTTKSMHGEGI